ncbi:FAD-binding protein [Congregibacter sp.]|uniref:FAD-binding protein n=1 Tax=Congregibacter sp. TaxID=2744308 RepID=UPI0039E2FA84
MARATCIATGGFGRIYRVSTNAIINEGMGAAIALESGRGVLGYMEAVQLHPTGDQEATLRYEEVDVTHMELPPGWRGYGAQDFIEHPDSALRLKDVAAVCDLHAEGEMRQEALMPFRSELPPRYRSFNQRPQLGDDAP